MAADAGYAVLARELRAAGFDTMFGVMGEANLDLVACLVERHQLRYIAARHESGAVAMAEGYARASGRIGVASVTWGPGLTNAITALVTAVRNQSEVLLVTGQLPLAATNRSQTIDHCALLRPTGALIVQVSQPHELPGAVARAVSAIREQHLPAVLNVLAPVLEGTCALTAAEPAIGLSDSPGNATKVSQVEDMTAFAAFAQALRAAKRPIIIAGRGVVQSGAGRPLEKLAEALDAGLATTLLANGLFAQHGHDLGIVGGLSSPRTLCALEAADVVAVFGASLNGWTTRGGSLWRNAKVLHCDGDPSAASRATVIVDVSIRGDASDVAMRMLETLTMREHASAPAARPLWWTQLVPPADQPEDPCVGLDPRSLCVALDSVLPVERTLTVDGGNFLEFPCRYMAVPDERAFVFTLGFGSVGLGLPTAIGAAVGRPDRLSVGVVGDGGLMMSLQEIETAARYRIPMVLLIMNDGGYGAEVKHLEDRGWRATLARFDNPDFAAVAKALGATGLTIEALRDVSGLALHLQQVQGPVVIDARVDPSVRAEWMAIMHAARRQ